LYFSVQIPDKPFNIFFIENSQNDSAIAFNHIEHPALVHSEPAVRVKAFQKGDDV
jgi:hypothetical protein